jgi:hypothetical protein
VWFNKSFCDRKLLSLSTRGDPARGRAHQAWDRRNDGPHLSVFRGQRGESILFGCGPCWTKPADPGGSSHACAPALLLFLWRLWSRCSRLTHREKGLARHQPRGRRRGREMALQPRERAPGSCVAMAPGVVMSCHGSWGSTLAKAELTQCKGLPVVTAGTHHAFCGRNPREEACHHGLSLPLCSPGSHFSKLSLTSVTAFAPSVRSYSYFCLSEFAQVSIVRSKFLVSETNRNPVLTFLCGVSCAHTRAHSHTKHKGAIRWTDNTNHGGCFSILTSLGFHCHGCGLFCFACVCESQSGFHDCGSFHLTGCKIPMYKYPKQFSQNCCMDLNLNSCAWAPIGSTWCCLVIFFLWMLRYFIMVLISRRRSPKVHSAFFFLLFFLSSLGYISVKSLFKVFSYAFFLLSTLIKKTNLPEVLVYLGCVCPFCLWKILTCALCPHFKVS